ncbi:DUF1800 domain-containing protein [Nocardioides bruguierae]|uniref:DUF1800 domain-containing protein n=1 Tax=Nocardioides bruguierae TaxID=2945102 RepID=A0A9X2D7G6_9ACTN|nr:DUF1800 domain-containing protein [Nocardioides bruguierae]MCM0620222.1 DUF1800 domain-containing protein [Nocardioides bruguierae]
MTSSASSVHGATGAQDAPAPLHLRPAPTGLGRRRALRALGGGTLVAGAAATGVATSPAAAAASRTRRPRRWNATPVASRADRHLLNRFTYGITPDLVEEVTRLGGPAWFEAQVAAATADPGAADRLVAGWWPDLSLTGVEVLARHTAGTRSLWLLMDDYAQRALARRIVSPHQVLEVMTEFWENHLHVPVAADNMGVLRVEYGDRVRAHALGRFEDLLRATTTHPAMLAYLNNNSSTRWHPNENLGRELLELHTVGVGNHTEDDIKDAARVLTGWTFTWGEFETRFRADWHATGAVDVCGFAHANTDATGKDAVGAMLTYLAHHPATARRIATKLVMTFVDAESVPEALVDRLAQAYLEHDTAIVPVLRVLLASPEFARAVDRRLRDADDDVVATYRVLGVRLTRPRNEASAARQLRSQAASLGLSPFAWPRPDGQPLGNRAWASPTRALASMTVHWQMASRTWPVVDVVHPTMTQLVPEGRLRFDQLVDHLSRRLLGRTASRSLLKAATAATRIGPGVRVDSRDRRLAAGWAQLVAAVLDSPEFYYH